MHDELVAHGRMDNFLRLDGKSSEPQKGPVYSDSDIYKWTEAVGFALQTADQPQLRNTTEAMIRDVVASQEPGGYLEHVLCRRQKALAHVVSDPGNGPRVILHWPPACRAQLPITGPRETEHLLDAGARFVDQFLLPNYGPGKDQKAIVAGHPEIEMASDRALSNHR